MSSMERTLDCTSWARETSKRLASLAFKARNVCSYKEHMVASLLSQFASGLEKLVWVFKEMGSDAENCGACFAECVMVKVDLDVKVAEELVEDYMGRSDLYLLMCCSELVGELEAWHANFKTGLDAICAGAYSDSLKLHVLQATKFLVQGAIKLTAKERTLCDSLEQGVLDSTVADPTLSAKLAQQIAGCLGTPVESEDFARQLAKLKMEKATVENKKSKAHSLYLEQFIVLLEKALSVISKTADGSPRENISPPSRQFTMRDTPFLPLQSFICPITKDVMTDPVQIASGQTYERTAIERWFSEGHTRCPTGVELKNTKMKPNFALRQSIAEWRERNYHIRLEIAQEYIRFEDREKQLKAVNDLQALCEEDSLNRYKVASMNIIPVLVHLAQSSDLELRTKTFSALRVLGKENAENQEIMVKEGIIDVLVRCLVGQHDEALQCVYLLRLLSKKPDIAEKISHTPSALLFLVTLIQDEDCAESVKAILENLPTSDENVVIMAEANIMGPLVSRLNEGGSDSRILMAKTLGRLHMPDNSKKVVATRELVHSLVKMMECGSKEECEASISALENLSSVPAISCLLEKLAAMQILLKLLKTAKSSQKVKIGSAQIFANVLIAIGDRWLANEAQLEELIFCFLQHLGPTAPAEVQCYLLQGLYALTHGKATSRSSKEMLKEFQVFKVLLSLLKVSREVDIRRRALELFSCLSETYGADASAAFKEQPGSLNKIVDMLKDESKELERLAATTIVAHLPSGDSYVQSVLTQAEAVPVLIQLLSNRNESLVEAAVGVLLRFTDSRMVEWQLKLAEAGVIQQFVALLHSPRSLTKERSARALANLSCSTSALSIPPAAPKCWDCFAQCPQVCKLHDGVCSVEKTLCLLEAGAVNPLLSVLREGDARCVMAALGALNTLVDNRKIEKWAYGYRAIAQANGLLMFIGLMSHTSPEIQELAAIICERFFGLAEYRNQYGPAAQMHIVAVAQKGSQQARQIAGRILRQLDLLHSQSNYFGLSSS